MKKMSDWRPFADGLTALAKTEGQTQFLNQAFKFLNDFVLVDSCAVFKVSLDKQSGAEHLCTFGKLDTDLTELLAKDYVANGFKNDPMVQTALLSPNIRVRRLSRGHYSQSYRSQYFKKAGLVDKVTSIQASRNVLFLISFYRVDGHGSFTTKNFRDLERLAPIIGRFVLRHIRLRQNIKNTESAYEQKISSLVEDNTQIFSKLSHKERQVCQKILLGHQEKDIAESLKIKLNTLVTHRRRIYAKLGANSKVELFQLALMASAE